MESRRGTEAFCKCSPVLILGGRLQGSRGTAGPQGHGDYWRKATRQKHLLGHLGCQERLYRLPVRKHGGWCAAVLVGTGYRPAKKKLHFVLPLPTQNTNCLDP